MVRARIEASQAFRTQAAPVRSGFWAAGCEVTPGRRRGSVTQASSRVCAELLVKSTLELPCSSRNQVPLLCTPAQSRTSFSFIAVFLVWFGLVLF